MSLSLRARAFIRLCRGAKAVLHEQHSQQLVDTFRTLTAAHIHSRLPESTDIEQGEINQVKVEWLTPSTIGASEDILLFLHGGAYVSGSASSHRDMVYRLADGIKAKAVSVDYRLAPENSYLDAFDDVISVYKGLLEQGFRSDNIVIAGDSSGAHLALILIRHLLNQALQAPKALICFSPIIDASNEMESRLRDQDPLIPNNAVMKLCNLIIPVQADYREPDFSPVNMSFEGFPPTYICASEHELFSDDACALYQALIDLDIEAELELYPSLPHGFAALSDILPEAKMAIREAAMFVRYLGVELDTKPIVTSVDNPLYQSIYRDNR